MGVLLLHETWALRMVQIDGWWLELQEGLNQLGKKGKKVVEEKGHLQNTYQLLFHAWFIAMDLRRHETENDFPFTSIFKTPSNLIFLFGEQVHLRCALLQPSHLLHHTSWRIPFIATSGSDFQPRWTFLRFCVCVNLWNFSLSSVTAARDPFNCKINSLVPLHFLLCTNTVNKAANNCINSSIFLQSTECYDLRAAFQAHAGGWYYHAEILKI